MQVAQKSPSLTPFLRDLPVCRRHSLSLAAALEFLPSVSESGTQYRALGVW